MKDVLEQYATDFLKNNEKYKKQVQKFLVFLKVKGKISQIAQLSPNDVDEFIGYRKQIKYENTMASYLEGLKSFQDFLIAKGYIKDDIIPHGAAFSDFKTKLTLKYDLKPEVEREYLEDEDICCMLNSIDKYFMNTTYTNLGPEAQERYLYWQCLRIYIKISLLAPAKKSKLLQLHFYDFSVEFRSFKLNGIHIRIPNGLRYNILQALDSIIEETGTAWNKDDLFFNYFITPIKISEDSLGTVLNAKFCKFLKDNNLLNIASYRTSYPLEVLSNTTIYHMVNYGTNPFFISQISGITIGQLANKYYNNLEDISYLVSVDTEVNRSISNCDYYNYI